MRKICLIYTGGTIGMRQNPNGKLAPVDFEELRKSIPALSLLPIELVVKTMDRPLDSSEMHPSVWANLASEIYAFMTNLTALSYCTVRIQWPLPPVH